MSERERWIVYPLLFLALGAALRDKLIDTTMSRRIVCQELVVVDAGHGPGGPVPIVRIGAVESATGNQPAMGQVLVDGRVDANAFFARGMPIAPTLRTNITLPDLFRAWQQSLQGVPAESPEDASPPPPSGAGIAPDQPPPPDGT